MDLTGQASSGAVVAASWAVVTLEGQPSDVNNKSGGAQLDPVGLGGADPSATGACVSLDPPLPRWLLPSYDVPSPLVSLLAEAARDRMGGAGGIGLTWALIFLSFY